MPPAPPIIKPLINILDTSTFWSAARACATRPVTPILKNPKNQ